MKFVFVQMSIKLSASVVASLGAGIKNTASLAFKAKAASIEATIKAALKASLDAKV